MVQSIVCRIRGRVPLLLRRFCQFSKGSEIQKKATKQLIQSEIVLLSLQVNCLSLIRVQAAYGEPVSSVPPILEEAGDERGSLHMEGWWLTGAHDFPGPARAPLTIFCLEEQNPGPQRKASGTGRALYVAGLRVDLHGSRPFSLCGLLPPLKKIFFKLFFATVLV